MDKHLAVRPLYVLNSSHALIHDFPPIETRTKVLQHAFLSRLRREHPLASGEAADQGPALRNRFRRRCHEG